MNIAMREGLFDELEKIASSRLRRAVRVVGDHKEGFRLLLGKRPIGRMTTGAADTALGAGPKSKGLRSIGETEIDPQFRGMGLGRKLYGEVMRRSPKQTLRSDVEVSGPASGVWGRLSKNPGYTVTKNPKTRTITRKATGEVRTEHGFPYVYEGRLPPAAAL